jgi:hypothetical protein
MTSKLRIIVTGLIAQHPMLGGVTWDYLQYVLGLARLGHNVFYFEDSGEWPYNLDGGPSGSDWIAHDPTPNLEHLATVMSRYGLEDRWAYRFPIKSQWYGLSDQKRRAVVESADLLLNVSGSIERPEEYRRARRLAYIDSDPVFSQIKFISDDQTDFRRTLETHDVYFSFGERFSSRVPVTGHRWRPTRQPVVLSEWRPSSARRDVYTTVMSWTSYKPLTYAGQTYGQKDVEFKRFLELPGKVRPALLEVALGGLQHAAWEGGSLLPAVSESPSTPQEVLTHSGWRVVEAADVCHDLDSYRQYIESSKAEWSVAKNGYVLGRAGWFSCRSACYLAAGKPVIVQDTGFADVIPVGEGILQFTDVDEAAAAIHEIEGNYSKHAKAARAIAEEYFDSDKVLNRLIDEAMNCEVSVSKAERPCTSVR